MDRFIEFALVAAHEALVQAGWHPTDVADQERTATIIASGVGGFGAIADAVRTTDARGPRRLSPFTAPSFLANMAAGHVSIRYGFKGPLGAPVTVCAAGVQAIGDAARLIRSGEADIAICGDTEAAIDRVTLGCFAAARALSAGFAEHPQEASRPFDRNRDGFVMSEGAGLLVIELLECPRAWSQAPGGAGRLWRQNSIRVLMVSVNPTLEPGASCVAVRAPRNSGRFKTRAPAVSMAPASGMLYHHHRSGVRFECFEHVRHIRQVADVVASVQQYRSSRRADMGTATAQHHVLYGAQWVGLR